MRNEILDIIYSAIRLENESLPEPIDLSAGEKTPLYGRGSAIDSMSLVSIVVEVEALMEQRVGQRLTLVDDSAMSSVRSPFATVGSFANYVSKRCGEVVDA
ncbi:hypothetical protein NS274_12835 [Pseudomonas oryzihabitans]|nr:hypothetical protein NS274_12835 [Pseudomonas psychrotolerans]KTT01395.1 hypothetical protein NS376_13830 [Pseudomonas psychrotolerans]